MTDPGEHAVEDEHLPQFGGVTGRNPADKNEQARHREEDPRPPTVQQDAQQWRAHGADQPGHRKYRRGVRCATTKGVLQRVEVHRLAVFSAALNGEIAQAQNEYHPTVMQAGAGGPQHARIRDCAGRWRPGSAG